MKVCSSLNGHQMFTAFRENAKLLQSIVIGDSRKVLNEKHESFVKLASSQEKYQHQIERTSRHHCVQYASSHSSYLYDWCCIEISFVILCTNDEEQSRTNGFLRHIYFCVSTNVTVSKIPHCRKSEAMTDLTTHCLVMKWTIMIQ